MKRTVQNKNGLLRLIYCKKYWVIAMICISLTAFGQEEQTIGNNEMKVNTILPLFQVIEVRYERLLNQNIGVGLTGAYSFNNFDSFRGMALSYLRLYPSKKKLAAGFFLEVNFGVIFSDDAYVYEDGIVNQPRATEETHEALGVGIGLGWKLMVYKRLFAEAQLGIGQEINEQSSITGYPNLGLNLGYRF